MPLNSQHLAESTINILNELPIDGEAARGMEIVYQTKVDIYDKKCNGCGFCRVTAISSDGREIKKFNNVDKAIDFASRNSFTLVRSCSYPDDVIVKNGKKCYPTLSEIVKNGCQFWRIDKLHIFSDEETEFVEVTNIEMESVISEPIFGHRTI